MCDQVEGFKTYLATAEADQLKFEEGEDIFSKYLPWAIIFELADRWAKICGDLVAMGRLPNETPYWYIGNYQMSAFNTSFLTSSLTSAATPVASSSGAGGTGFGGGSSFGGGGFSGGGWRGRRQRQLVMSRSVRRQLMAVLGVGPGECPMVHDWLRNDAGQHERDLRAPQPEDAGHAGTA